MKSSCLLLGLVLVVCSFARAQPPAKAEPTKWVLTFEDNFDGDHLDLSKWTPQDPWGRARNSELQAYVPGAFVVKDGVLHVTAEHRDAEYGHKLRHYTSGMMTTTGKFSQEYGKFEIRCRVPAGKGMWPAFWMLPEPPTWPPEIDVLEILGHQPDRLYMTHHWMDEHHKHRSHGGQFRGPDFSKDFHTFGVTWSPDAIVWTVDGVERFRSTKAVPHQPMFLMVNLAVGGDWPGSPDEHTKFPASFDVDWVRVWKRADGK